MSEITPEFLRRQITRMIEDVAAVNTRLAHIETKITDVLARAQHQHDTLHDAITELGELHRLNARMHERLRKLEDAYPELIARDT
jgi:ABC-type transporter Mla subunit MlaD